MIRPYEYAPDASIYLGEKIGQRWTRSVSKRGSSYSIFLDGSALPELRKFLQTRKDKGAVEIGGKKWAVSVGEFSERARLEEGIRGAKREMKT